MNGPSAKDGTVEEKSKNNNNNDLLGNDQLERCGRWLESIPRDDVASLRNTVEFRDFLRAFENLGRAHLGVMSNHPHRDEGLSNTHSNHEKRKRRNHEISKQKKNSRELEESESNPQRRNQILNTTTVTHSNGSGNHLLRFTDDILLKILEFLKCKCMIQTSLTCSRFRQLVEKSAVQRTHSFAKTRQLGNTLQLLRAREQIYHYNESSPSVPVPMLLPGRRVLVTNAGDPEYNGIYHCTDCNGNGFVFTKPRYSCHEQPPQTMLLEGEDNANNNNNNNNNITQRAGPLPMANHNVNEETNARRSSETSTRSELPLRCVIAKAYSNHDVFWYMSKEIDTSDSRPRKYSFYAPLMLAGNAPSELTVYPSQTSVLYHQNQAWGSLRATTDGLHAPTLEVLSESGCPSTSMVLENQ